MSSSPDVKTSAWCRGAWLRPIVTLGLAALAVLVAMPALQAAPKRIALLVGIGDYAHARDLQGARNDAEALRQVLIEDWDFAAQDIVTLVDEQATKARIRTELARLTERSAPGDHVLFYFSGHGTSRYDPAANLPLDPHSGAVLPYDGMIHGTPDELASHLLVGRTDVRPLLSAIDRDREITVIYDACFSGNAVRSLARVTPIRHQIVKVDDAWLVGLDSPYKPIQQPPPAPEYPYQNVYFLAAASDREAAIDIDSLLLDRHPTLDGKAHGAFTDAMLRVLTGDIAADANGDGLLTNAELKEAIHRRLAEQQIPHTPQSLPPFLEDRRGLSKRVVFSANRPMAPSTPALPKVRPLRVHLDLDLVPQTLTEALQSLNHVQLVGGDRIADVLVQPRRPYGYRLLHGHGELIGVVGPRADLTERLGQLAWLHRLTERAATANPFVMRLRLTQESCGEVLCLGSRISLNLETERTVHVLLLDLDPSGAINQLYPVTPSELNPLSPGTASQWPASLDGRPDPIRVQEPVGTDSVIAYGFTERPAFLVPAARTLAADDPLLAKLDAYLADHPDKVAVATLPLVVKTCEEALQDDLTRCTVTTQ